MLLLLLLPLLLVVDNWGHGSGQTRSPLHRPLARPLRSLLAHEPPNVCSISRPTTDLCCDLAVLRLPQRLVAFGGKILVGVLARIIRAICVHRENKSRESIRVALVTHFLRIALSPFPKDNSANGLRIELRIKIGIFLRIYSRESIRTSQNYPHSRAN